MREKETPPGKLREVMANTAEELVRRTAQLAGLVQKEFDGGNTSGVEVAAALWVIAEIARAGSTIFREQGGVIFEKGQESATVEAVSKEEKPSQPTTFAELLKVRIEEALPSGKEDFKKKEVVEFLGNRSGTRKVMTSLGLASQRKLTRMQVFEIVEKMLTPSLGIKRETYTRSRLASAFLVNKEQLEKWSELIGFDWNLHPTVDKSEALAIRGLRALEKLTEGNPKS